jgi:copper oxidase (laccase) domain-containing protein
MTPVLPLPRIKKTICNGSATVFAWGVHKTEHPDKNYNWSLRRLQEPDYEVPPLLLVEHTKNSTVWAPVPTQFNGLVVNPKETFFDQIDTRNEGIIIRRGVYADGVVLHSPMDVFLVTPADCATCVISYDDAHGQRKVIAGHASRDSLINMGQFRLNKITRSYEGLIESALAHIPKASRQTAHAWVGLSISPGPHFAHDARNRDCPWNELMVNYIREKYGDVCFKDDGDDFRKGWLDQKQLVVSQLLCGGIPKENIETDDVCTYADTDKYGNHLWYSNVRNNEKKDEAYRNFVFVTKNF